MIRGFEAVYFAASVDRPETNKSFAQSLEADFPILSDPERSVALAYGVVKDAKSFAARTTFYIGPDGKILYIDAQVRPETHGKVVAAKLAEFGVPRRKAPAG